MEARLPGALSLTPPAAIGGRDDPLHAGALTHSTEGFAKRADDIP
jgi:hypothetical protein